MPKKSKTYQNKFKIFKFHAKVSKIATQNQPSQNTTQDAIGLSPTLNPYIVPNVSIKVRDQNTKLIHNA